MIIIGVAGGSGSGKTTVVKKIMTGLPSSSTVMIPQDAYYFDNGHLSAEEKLNINFDHPNSIEWDLLIEQLNELKADRKIEMPTYSYINSARLKETVSIEPCEIVFIEGILVFTNPDLIKLMDIKVFVDAENDDRLARIIGRDILERGRSIKQVLDHYYKWVKPMHQQFIEPSKRMADIIVPQGGENKVAIDLIVSAILMKLHNNVD